MDRGARTFYSPLKRVSMKQGGKVICTLLSTARANRVQSCSDLVCVRKITSSTNYSLGSMSGDAICKNRYTVRSVHLSEQGCARTLDATPANSAKSPERGRRSSQTCTTQSAFPALPFCISTHACALQPTVMPFHVVRARIMLTALLRALSAQPLEPPALKPELRALCFKPCAPPHLF